jgi:hypothetical protein
MMISDKQEEIMKTLGEIELELSRLGLHNRFWGKPEVRELQHILSDDEIMTNAVNGRYEGGFALLVSTDRRLLLIDKKIWFLSLEDTRYDMISEVDYNARLLDATVYIRTINKVMRFTTPRQKSLRALVTYVQEKVMELRQQAAAPSAVDNNQLMQQFSAFANHMMSQQPAQQHQSVVVPAQAQQATPNPIIPMRPFKRLGAYPTASFTTQTGRPFSAGHQPQV